MVGPASQYYTFSIYISLPKNRCINSKATKEANCDPIRYERLNGKSGRRWDWRPMTSELAK